MISASEGLEMTKKGVFTSCGLSILTPHWLKTQATIEVNA